MIRLEARKTYFYSPIKLLSVMMAILLYLVYAMARVGVEQFPPHLPLIISVTILLLPDVIKLGSNLPIGLLQMGVLLFFFILGWISILLNIDVSLILYGVFGLSTYFFFSGAKKNLEKKTGLAIKIMALLLSLKLISAVWNQAYLNPLAPEAFVLGSHFVHIDTLFLASITGMIKTYQIPSLGLFGLAPLTYHSGSNFLFASMSQLSKTSVLQFYNLGFPVIFIPLFFQALCYAALPEFKIKSNGIRILAGLIILFFLLSGFLSDRIGTRFLLPSTTNAHLLSQSYCVSLIYLFLAISIYAPIFKKGNVDYQKNTFLLLIALIPVWVFCIGYTKISTVLVIFPIFTYALMRRSLLFKKYVLISILVSAIVLYYVLDLAMETTKEDLIIQFGAFYKVFIDGPIFFYFVLAYIWYVLFVVAALAMQKRSAFRWRQFVAGKFITIELLTLTAIIGIIPGLLIHIPGASALYFCDMQYWLSGIAFINVAPYFVYKIYKKRDKFLMPIRIGMFILLVIMVRDSVFRSFYYFVKNNIRIRMGLVYGKETTLENVHSDILSFKPLTSSLNTSGEYQTQVEYLALPLFKSLRGLSPEVKRTSIIYCEEQSEVNSFMACTEANFWITAISEIAMINGLLWRDCLPNGAYGMGPYETFPKEMTYNDACVLAKQKGFKNVIVVNLKSKVYRIVKL